MSSSKALPRDGRGRELHGGDAPLVRRDVAREAADVVQHGLRGRQCVRSSASVAIASSRNTCIASPGSSGQGWSASGMIVSVPTTVAPVGSTSARWRSPTTYVTSWPRRTSSAMTAEARDRCDWARSRLPSRSACRKFCRHAVASVPPSRRGRAHPVLGSRGLRLRRRDDKGLDGRVLLEGFTEVGHRRQGHLRRAQQRVRPARA